jgi:hypothetical protein
VVETTAVVPLRTFGELDEHSEEGEVGDHADDGEGDLHFWLDPLLLAEAAEALAEEMSAMDPEHREEYAAGYRALRRDLTALDGRSPPGWMSVPWRPWWSATTRSATGAGTAWTLSPSTASPPMPSPPRPTSRSCRT